MKYRYSEASVRRCAPLMGPYLLSLLDGGHGIRLELQLVCPTQLPVQD